MTAKENICKNCGHGRNGHKDNWGGICVGCPCPGFEPMDAAESLPAQTDLAELLKNTKPATEEELRQQRESYAANYKPGPRQCVPFEPVAPVEATSMFPPLGDRSLHFEDDAVIAAMEGTEYLVGGVRQRLSHMTTGEKWSLYRAIVKLAAAKGSTDTEGR